MLPPERILKRFAALRLVFILGIACSCLSWRRAAPRWERFTGPNATSSRKRPASGRYGRLRILLDRLCRRLLHLFLALLRRQHHDELPAFHLRVLLHHRVRLEVLLHALDQPHAELL